MSAIGHNSLAGDTLKAIVARVEAIEDEMQALSESRKELYAEVKAAGYDAKIVRQAVKVKRMTAEQRGKRDENEQLLDLYLHALGALNS